VLLGILESVVPLLPEPAPSSTPLLLLLLPGLFEDSSLGSVMLLL
jgi:hypothetical protein